MERLRGLNSEFFPGRLLASTLIKELSIRHLTIAVADGCGGGSLLDLLTIPGATKAFHLGGVFCSLESKVRELGVPENIIAEYGEHSLPTAIAMAQAIQKIRGDSLAVATVGNMDSSDNSKPRQVFLGFSMEARKPWGKAIILQPQPLRLMKEQLAEAAFSSALFYLLGQKDKDIKRHVFPFHRIRSLTPDLLEVAEKAQRFISALKTSNFSLALMESCTGGALAHAITDVSGANEVLELCWVTYDEKEKQRLGVDFEVMKYGVYTEKVALVMADAIWKRTGVDMAIAVTGTMDTIDTRPYHNDNPRGAIYVAVILRGKKPLVSKLLIKPRSRQEMKIEVVGEIFDLALEVLTASEQKLFYLHTADYDFCFLNRA